MRHEVKTIGDLDYCCVINACGVVKALDEQIESLKQQGIL